VEQRPGTANGESFRPPVRLLLIAATRLYREGLAQLLARDPRIDLVGAAADVAGGRVAIGDRAPDGVLLDAAMAGDRRAVGELIAASAKPGLRIVAFGVAGDEATVIACAEAGVAGYVPCEADVDELVNVVVGAIRDELVCDPRLAGALLRRIGALARERRDTETNVRLTGREAEIIALIDDGLSNKQIAARLQISLPTVKKHIHNLLGKLGASRRSEAVAHARALQLRVPDRIS
jgi:DNA-binding NarL/FixJ family response regulator